MWKTVHRNVVVRSCPQAVEVVCQVSKSGVQNLGGCLGGLMDCFQLLHEGQLLEVAA